MKKAVVSNYIKTRLKHRAIICIAFVASVLLLFTIIKPHDDVENSGYKILIQENVGTNYVDMESFILNVIMKILPVDSPPEVIKMQSVLARTNIMRIMGIDAEIQSSKLSMAFISDKELKKQWGTEFYSNYNRINSYIKETRGEVIRYKSELIEPYFCNMTSGLTRDGMAEFRDEKFGYLTVEDSKWDLSSDEYSSQDYYTIEEVVKILRKKSKVKKLSLENFFDNVYIVKKDKSGYVTGVYVCGKTVTGDTFASWFKLHSTCFTIEKCITIDKPKIRISTKGRGLGFGISLYGARQMALLGKKYKEIINYYYKNVDIGQY